MSENNLGVARGAVEINTSSLKNADIALRSAGTSMLNFGQNAIRAFAGIVNEAAKFEKEMDFVQAVTASSGEEMARLRKKALDLAKDSIFGPVELAKAFVDLAKAGATAQQIIDGVGEASVALAQSADVPIPFAGENLINILNTFRLGAEDAMSVADLLAGAANASSVELNDLVISMKYAGPVASGLGISLSDVNDALTILGKVGIRGSTAGTSLRAILLRIGEDSGPAHDALVDLGIVTADGANRFFDAQGNAKGLAEIFGILADATKNLNSEQKVAVLSNLFGQRAIPSALELLRQGEQGFADINAEINRTTAADVAAKRMDNLSGSIKRLQATLKAMFVDAGGPFQKFLKGAVDGLRDFLLWIDKLPSPVKTALVAFIGIIGVLSILAGAFLLTIGNIVRMVRVFGEIHNGLRVLTGLIRGATVATEAQTGATAASNATLLASPIFWVIAALVALGVAFYVLYKKSEGFRKFIDALWQSIQRLWDVVLNGLIVGLKAAIDWFSELPRHVGQAFDAVLNFFNNLPGVIGRAVLAAAKAVGGFFEGLASSAVSVFGSALSAVGSFLSNVISTVAGFMLRLPGIIARGFVTMMQAIGQALLKLPGLLLYGIGFIIGFAIRIGIILVKAFVEAIIAIGSVLIKLPGLVLRTLGLVLKTVGTWAVKLVLLLVRVALLIISTIGQALLKLPGLIVEVFSAILDFFVEWGPKVLQFLIELFINIVKAIINEIIALPGQIWEVFTSIISGLGSFIGGAFNLAKSIGKAIWDGLIDFISGLPQKVWDIFMSIIDKIKSFFTGAWNAAKGFAGSLWSGFKSGLGIKSPSFIEKALFKIEDQAALTARNLRGSVGIMQGLGRTVPTLAPAAIGLAAPRLAISTPAPSGFTYQQNAPLVGQATIRSDQDIDMLARRLHDLQQNKMAARGRREINR